MNNENCPQTFSDCLGPESKIFILMALNKNLEKLMRKKTKLYKYAKQNGDWTKYKMIQKVCRKEFRDAENNYINSTINKGLEENNSKPFWRYIKSKKNDNVGVAPLKEKGKLIVPPQNSDTS